MPWTWSSMCSQSRTWAPSPYSGTGLTVQQVGDEERDDLLGEVVVPVVVGTAGHPHVESVGAVVGQRDQVAGGLGGGVRGGGRERFVLGPGALVDRSVDLVGGDVHEGPDARQMSGVDEGVGAQDVRTHELGAAVDGAVHMRLGGEVHHLVVPGHETADQFRVTDVALDEREAGVAAHGVEVGRTARVGELVEHGDGDVAGAVRAQQRTDVVGADEAGAAGHQEVGRHEEICTLLWSPRTSRWAEGLRGAGVTSTSWPMRRPRRGGRRRSRRPAGRWSTRSRCPRSGSRGRPR